MATRVIPPRILRNLRYNTATKPLLHSPPHPSLSSPTLSPPTTPTSSLLDPKPPSSTVLLPPPSSSALDFHNVEKLFSSVPTPKLLRSTAVLHATALEPMVDLGMWVMRSKLVQSHKALRELSLFAIRNSFFDHFCSGEEASSAAASISALNDAGLRGMLVYGVEDAHDNAACDRNLNAFLHTVDKTMRYQSGRCHP